MIAALLFLLASGFARVALKKAVFGGTRIAYARRPVEDRKRKTCGSPRGFPFPGRRAQERLKEIQRLWYAVRSEARLDKVRLHDLRHSVASFADGRGYSLFLIGKLLGHRDTRSTQRYAHLADDIRKSMADDVGEVIREAMDSDPETRPFAPPVRQMRLTRARQIHLRRPRADL